MSSPLALFVRRTRSDSGQCGTRLAIGCGITMAGALILTLLVIPLASMNTGMVGAVDAMECTPGSTTEQADASEYAAEDIPEDYLELYQDAAEDRGIPWNVLAAVGQVESHHGRWDGPGITEGYNEAGAAGPMQFGTQEDMAATNTWGGEPVQDVEDRPDEGYGIDGNDDDVVDVYDPADAIPAAADYLVEHGAPEDMEDALFAYNRAWWYVDDVLEVAESYADGDYEVDDGIERAVNCGVTDEGEPIGEAPDELSQEVVDWAMDQRGQPYVWGGTGPNGFDCSGLTMKAYESIGVNIPRIARDQWDFGPEVSQGEEQPGDLVFFDVPHQDGGAGPGHMGMVIGDGLMVEAWCTDCGPIATREYDDPNRADILGFTRPLEHEDVQVQLDL